MTFDHEDGYEDRRLARLLNEGRGSEALGLLWSQDRVVSGDNVAATLDAMVTDWHRDYANGADALMVAGNSCDVKYLNERARELRRVAGALGDEEMGVWASELPFSAGDRVLTRIDSRLTSDGERWNVRYVDREFGIIGLSRLGDGKRAALSADFLNRSREVDGGPMLEHAYAVCSQGYELTELGYSTGYGEPGEFIDRVYPLLDRDAGLEQDLIALSRGREVGNVYAIAAPERTDIAPGPSHRELSDQLDYIRIASERTDSQFHYWTYRLRQNIKALSPAELAGRRIALDALAPPCMACEGSGRYPDLPALMDAAGMPCEHCIGGRVPVRDPGPLLRHLSLEREDLARPLNVELAAELERVSAVELAVNRYCRGIAEPASAEEPGALASASRSLDAEACVEMNLLDTEVNRRVSTRLAKDRDVPSSIVGKALGPCPHWDASDSLAWHKGARALYTYRIRHGVLDSDRALGDPPFRRTERAEHSRAQRQIEAAQRRLGLSADRAAQRALGRSQGIGR